VREVVNLKVRGFTVCIMDASGLRYYPIAFDQKWALARRKPRYFNPW